MKYVLVSTLWFSGSAYCALPHFNNLPSSSGQSSALSMVCDEYSDQKIQCHFNQTSVMKNKPEYTSEQFRKILQLELDEKMQGISIEQFKKNEFGDLCQSDFDNLQVTDLQKEVISGSCRASSKQELVSVYANMHEAKLRTCKVNNIDTGSYLFDQISENKWVSTNKPIGKCGAVLILSIERESSDRPLWTFNQVRHYTNTSSEMCAKLQSINETMTYSWSGQKTIEKDCDYIEFGF
ncbi:hypothetical protein JC525_08870 [Alteromonas sp. IB21]|uniref:hypothetical protein n=1 Tax=Alteromonas sp. IB21 TaxID=2779369 RepID=UPI0018E7DD99|nr:hypothetical protein [Alteromonas sp. IB21]MBJ2129047.1 hypothetical protein [Alteromonas sp. IB21]